jgi:zinc transport system permease protein
MLFLILIAVVLFWVLFSNRLILVSIHPQLASSRGLRVSWIQSLFTVAIAVVVTLAISWVGLLILNSLLVLPGAASRNVARNMRQYHFISILFALISGIGGLWVSYHLGTSTGAAICLILAVCFAVSFCFRKVRA